MKLTNLVRICLFMLAITGGAFQAHAQTVEIKLNLREGDRYPYFFNYESTTQNNEETIKTTVGAGMTMTVGGMAGADRVLKTDYDRMVMKMEGGALSFDVDTDRPRPTVEEVMATPMLMMQLVFSAVKNQRFSIQVNPQGELTLINGFEEIGDNLIDSVASWIPLPPETLDAMRQGVSKSFRSESARELMAQSFNIFPGRPVKVGDSWTKTFGGPNPTDKKVTNTYTLTAFNDKEANIAVKSVFNQWQTTEGVIMEGTQEGMLTVELKTGMVIRNELNQNLTSDFNGVKSTVTGKATTRRQ